MSAFVAHTFRYMHRLQELVDQSARTADVAMDAFLAQELPLLVADPTLREEIATLWRSKLRNFRARALQATGTQKIPMPLSSDQSKRRVLDALKQTQVVARPAKFEVCWDQLAHATAAWTGTRTIHTTRAITEKETHEPDTLLEMLMSDRKTGYEERGVSEFVLTPELVEKLSKDYATRVYGTRFLTEGGKRKRTSAFDTKSGVVQVAMTDGFVQLVDGLIELFFKRIDLTLGNFFNV